MFQRDKTPAMQAHDRLYASTPAERITTHIRPSAQQQGGPGTTSHVIRERVIACKTAGMTPTETRARLNLGRRTVSRWWNT